MGEIHVFTSAASNYIPKARILFSSLKSFHPQWRCHVALADAPNDGFGSEDEPFDALWPIAELGIPRWKGWAFCHTIVELATAIKPFMLARLLEQEGCQAVLYFDPDIAVFSPLEDITDALEASNILLTPHLTDPETSLSGVMDNEISSLRHGVYNLGFIGVSATREGRRFADWWSRRLYHFCRADICNGLFTDQRWIDLVPGFFDGVAVMHSPRHNVASWNISSRLIEKSPRGGYLVNGEPLGFYHFTGFDSGAHEIMLERYGNDNPALRCLIAEYRSQIRSQSSDPLSKQTWAFGCYDDGTPIDPVQRMVFRDRPDLQAAFPDPYRADGYLHWWMTQGRKEYPELFQKDVERVRAIERLRHRLTPGYLGDAPQEKPMGPVAAMVDAARRPRTAVAKGRLGWRVLRTEGWRGLRRRMMRWS